MISKLKLLWEIWQRIQPWTNNKEFTVYCDVGLIWKLHDSKEFGR